MTDETLASLAARIRAREVTPVEATEACLARIAAHGPRLRAFLHVDADAALRVARAGATAYPANAVLQNNLAVLLELSGDMAGAEAALRTALTEDPSLPQVSKNLADILYRNGRYDEAREGYERAAKLAPDLGDDLYFKLGNLAYKRRDHAAARAAWTRATELNPRHELARANLEMLDLVP